MVCASTKICGFITAKVTITSINESLCNLTYQIGTTVSVTIAIQRNNIYLHPSMHINMQQRVLNIHERRAECRDIHVK